MKTRYPRSEFLVLTHKVQKIVVKLKLGKEVSDRAGEICADAVAMGISRALPRSALAAAAIYVACRERREPVTQKELAAAGGCELREIGRSYEMILERTHIMRPELNGRTFLQRIAIKALPQEVYKMAEEIVNWTSSAGLNGRHPMTLAAAALYLASCNLGERLTQAEAAEAAGVAEESVRECCKVIRSASLSSPEVQHRARRMPSGPQRAKGT